MTFESTIEAVFIGVVVGCLMWLFSKYVYEKFF